MGSISEKTRIKISQTLKGHAVSKETREKIKNSLSGRVGANKGKKFSTKWRKNISKALKGRKLSEQHRQNVIIATTRRWENEEYKKSICLKSSMAQKGRKLSLERRNKMKGTNNHLWNGGITPLHLMIRELSESKQWRKQVFERDNYACQNCGLKGIYLEAHHNKKSFSKILQEFLQEYNQFSPIDDKETLVRLAINWKPFWDIDNGKTLCRDCHKNINIVEEMKCLV